MKVLAKKLWLVAIAVRLIAAAVLLFGPWTDSANELAGWDIERFHLIANAEGQPYVDFEVEYPPGSVVAIEALSKTTGSSDVVALHRSLLVFALLADLATAAMLKLVAGRCSAQMYLVLGLPLVPMGLLRLDLITTFAAVIAFWALTSKMTVDDRDDSNVATVAGEPLRFRARHGNAITLGVFGLAIAVGTMVKIWPALVVAASVSLRRFSHALSAATTTAAFGLIWLIWVGDGIAPVAQVLSLRGATGWHVESTPGSFVALVSSDEPRLELNAFRIGTIQPAVVLVGRVISVATMTGLAIFGLHRLSRRPQTKDSIVRIGAIVSLGCVASLLLTAPLLSPQFILWLSPWAAILSAEPAKAEDVHVQANGDSSKLLVGATGLVALLTGGTLLLFGPAGVSDSIPAAVLVLRNLTLAAIVGLCFHAIYSTMLPQHP